LLDEKKNNVKEEGNQEEPEDEKVQYRKKRR